MMFKVHKKFSLWIKRWSTDASFSFLITGRFRYKYSAISKMIPHSLDLSPSRSLQLAKYAKCSWISWNWDTVLVYTGPDTFLNGQKLAQIRLSFTRDLRNPKRSLSWSENDIESCKHMNRASVFTVCAKKAWLRAFDKSDSRKQYCKLFQIQGTVPGKPVAQVNEV